MRRISALLVLAAASMALAVSPTAITHNTERDFAAGEFDGTVVSSLGELQLGRDVKVLLASDAAGASLSAVAVAGDVVYAASGSDTAIYRIAGGKSEKLATPPGTVVNCLLWTGKDLLAGTGGEDGGVYRIDAAGKHSPLWTDKDVQYVWALVAGPDGTVYAATGSKAAIYAVDKAGKAELIYEMPKTIDNVLCLALDKGGRLLAGTDSEGLVFQIDPATKPGRVLLDAEEEEVSAVVPDGEGGVYASTADADKAGASNTKGSDSLDDEMLDLSPFGDSDIDFSTDGGEGDSDDDTSAAASHARSLDDLLKAATKKSASKTAGPTKSAGKARLVTDSADADEKLAAMESTTKPTSKPATRPATRPAATRPAAAKTSSRSPSSSRSGASGPMFRGGMMGDMAEGNAVYHIGADGLMKVVFRKSIAILDMQMIGGKLILATGNDGAIYALTPRGDEVSQLVNTDAKQVVSLAAGAGGSIVFATANKGSVGTIGGALTQQGTYTSPALDASQIARWGSALVRARVPAAGKLTVASRTGNLTEPDDKTWSPWSQEMPADEGYVSLASPAGRFVQYRLTLSAGQELSPVVREVDVVYQVGNLAPVIASVGVQSLAGSSGGSDTFDMPMPSMSRSPLSSPSRSPSMPRLPSRTPSRSRTVSGPPAGGMPVRSIEIQATDPNNDELTYKLLFREVGSEVWVKMADKLEGSDYSWDTRTVPDGKYEVKALVSDSLSNPPGSALETNKTSPIIVVDNTPPVIRELAAKAGPKSATVSGSVVDATSRIVSIHYSVDSAEEWTTVLPADGICDTPSEKFAFEAANLAAGAHRIAVKVSDIYGNVVYATANVTIAEK